MLGLYQSRIGTWAVWAPWDISHVINKYLLAIQRDMVNGIVGLFVIFHPKPTSDMETKIERNIKKLYLRTD